MRDSNETELLRPDAAQATWHARLTQGRPAAPPPASLPPGFPPAPEGLPVATEGDLQTVALLGEGGMGRVQLANQVSLDRPVAVKHLLPWLRVPGYEQALVREARITGRLEHPNVVPVHALGWTEESGPFLVMKRVEGRPWSELLGAPQHPGWGDDDDALEARNLRVFLEVCRAVHFAHTRGFVHLDVKPENVMVGAHGEVVLVDWGIARELEPTPRQITLTGTPAFLAPEMARYGGRLDPRTDVYLLGATLTLVLSGQLRNRGATAEEAVASALRPSPHPWPAQAPPELVAICERACAHRRADRWPDADQLRRAVLGHLRHRASMDAARLASAGLERLRARIAAGETDAGALYREHGACRFGFEHALQAWPENAEARDGLREGIVLLAGYEARAGHGRAAAALTADLAEAPAELMERVRVATEREDEQRRAQERLDRLRGDLRLAGRDWGRSIATLLGPLFAWSMAIPAGLAMRRAGMEVNLATANVLTLALTAVLVVGVLVMRRQLLGNVLYARTMVAMVLIGPVMLFCHLGGWRAGMTWPQVLTMDLAAVAALASAVAVLLGGFFWFTGLCAVATAMAAMIRLEWALEVVAVGFTLHAVGLAWALRPRRRNAVPVSGTGRTATECPPAKLT